MNAILKNKNLILVIAIFSCSFFLATAWAGEHSQKGRSASSTPGDGERSPMFATKKVTIAKKSLETITTNIGGKFFLSDNTIIVGTDGHQVSIRKLLVPCDAEVAYSREKGKRMAERVNIRRVGANASSQWTSDSAD